MYPRSTHLQTNPPPNNPKTNLLYHFHTPFPYLTKHYPYVTIGYFRYDYKDPKYNYYPILRMSARNEVVFL